MNHKANVSISTANARFRNGIFSSCNIQGNVQVFFGLPTRSEDKNDLTLLDIFAVFLYFESRMVFLIMRFFLPKLALPEIGN